MKEGKISLSTLVRNYSTKFRRWKFNTVIMKNLLLSLTLLLSFFACNKEPEPKDYTEVEGQLLDAATHTPIKNGKVSLYLGLGTRVLMDTLTDENGRYYFKYFQGELQQFGTTLTSVAAEAENYLANDNVGHFGLDYPTHGKLTIDKDGFKNTIDIVLPPIGYVKYIFNYNSGIPDFTKVRFIPYNTTVQTRTAANISEPYVSRYPGGSTYRVGVSIFFKDTLFDSRDDYPFIPRFDTLIYYNEF